MRKTALVGVQSENEEEISEENSNTGLDFDYM